MLKVLFWCLYCQLQTYYTIFSTASMVELQQLNICGEVSNEKLSAISVNPLSATSRNGQTHSSGLLAISRRTV